jgi:predicted AAA+ superfamily ATPase
MKERQIQSVIEELCFGDHKMAFISGPRQCGKTTLSRMLQERRGCGAYHNWDDVTFRREWVKGPARTLPQAVKGVVPVVIFDEIHKAKGWKRSLKGLYDTLDAPVDILVTGSARLNVYRRGSDSLLGRYHHFRLHPFSLGEMLSPTWSPPPSRGDDLCLPEADSQVAQEHMDAMMEFGTFPEPLLVQSARKARLWRRERRERVIREDIRDMTRTLELSQIEMLAALIPPRVGAPVSVASFRDMLEVSHATVTRWLNWLKEVYYIFEVKPYSNHVVRSLKKEGKLYMWDPAEVPNEAERFENLIASHMLKACHLWTDAGDGEFELCYLRNKDKQEIDFLILRDGVPWLPVEVKLSDETPSPNWRRFLPALPCRSGIQVCRQAGVGRRFVEGERSVMVVSAGRFLSSLP